MVDREKEGFTDAEKNQVNIYIVFRSRMKYADTRQREIKSSGTGLCSVGLSTVHLDF